MCDTAVLVNLLPYSFPGSMNNQGSLFFTLGGNDKSKNNISVPRQGTLWGFGDSVTGRFMGSIRKKPLCKKTTTCTTTSLWVYPLSNNAKKHRSYDKRDFQPNIILDEIKNILRDPKMKYRNSTFLINLGIHYTLSINFTTYQKLIDEVLVILRNRKELGSNAKIVWKTITTIRKELEKPNGNSMTWRFISEPVVIQFI